MLRSLQYDLSLCLWCFEDTEEYENSDCNYEYNEYCYIFRFRMTIG